MIMTEARFTAVQDDPASFCMDWPVFDHRAVGSRFTGAVFVLDAAGVRVADAPMGNPGDACADHVLRGIGWTRTGEWRPDGFGRPTARVQRRVAGDQGWLPVQPLASLAEEACLHLG